MNIHCVLAACSWMLAVLAFIARCSTADELRIVSASAELARRLTLPEGERDIVGHVGLDSDHTLWAVIGEHVYFLENNRFRVPIAGNLSHGNQFLTAFFGGQDRALYVTQPGDREHEGKIYQLKNKRAVYVTSFYYEHGHYQPNLYVSKSGHLFNWGRDFLAVYAQDHWKRFPAQLGERPPIILETARVAYFLAGGKLLSVDLSSRPDELRVSPEPTGKLNGKALLGALLGNDKAVVADAYALEFFVFDLATGKPVNVAELEEDLKLGIISAVDRAPDGSVWVLKYNARLQKDVFYRVSADGHVTLLDPQSSTDIFWGDNRARSDVSTICFATQQDGILRYESEKFVHYGVGWPFNLNHCHAVLQDAAGTLYAASGTGIYVLHARNGERPGEPPPIIPKKIAWRHEAGEETFLLEAWHVDSGVCFSNASPNFGAEQLVLIDAASGEQKMSLELQDGEKGSAWVIPSRRNGEMLLTTSERIVRIDLRTGLVTKTTNYRYFSSFIAPIMIEDDYVLTQSNSHLVRIDQDGGEIWECPRPGETTFSPAVWTSTAIVQSWERHTRKQWTAAVDLKTGEVLWSKDLETYGRGIATANDGSFEVEAHAGQFPNEGEATLICCDTRTGTTQWIHRRRGEIDHKPAVHPQTSRVFAVLNSGLVVCLDGKNGKVAWEARMPENTIANRTISQRKPYWPALAVHGDQLMVLDRNNVLHFFDTSSGKRAASVAITSIFSRGGVSSTEVDPVTMPWVEAGLLIVPTTRGVAAYPIDQFIPSR